MVPSPTPKRDHDPQSFGLEAQIKGFWSGRGDLNPHAHVWAQPPQGCASANFATSARLEIVP